MFLSLRYLKKNSILLLLFYLSSVSLNITADQYHGCIIILFDISFSFALFVWGYFADPNTFLDLLLNPTCIFGSVVIDKWPLDFKCPRSKLFHREITSLPRIEPAIPGLQIECSTYSANCLLGGHFHL